MEVKEALLKYLLYGKKMELSMDLIPSLLRYGEMEKEIDRESSEKKQNQIKLAMAYKLIEIIEKAKKYSDILDVDISDYELYENDMGKVNAKKIR